MVPPLASLIAVVRVEASESVSSEQRFTKSEGSKSE